MAQLAGTWDSTDAANSRREDLANFIMNIDRSDTPFISMIGTVNVKDTYHEWQTANLSAVNTSNALIEGDEAPTATANGTNRVGNYTQISGKAVVVSRTQMQTNNAGKTDEMQYQVFEKGLELRKDMEAIILSNQAAVAGNSSTARLLHGLPAWVTSNVSRGASGANGVAPGLGTIAAATNGTLRTFTESQLKTVMKSLYTNGANPSKIMLHPDLQESFNAFNGLATPVVDVSNKERIGTVQRYVGNFNIALDVVPNYLQRSRDAWLIDTRYVKLGFLAPIFESELATTGDYKRKSLTTEYTLRVDNQQGIGLVTDIQ